MPLACRFVGRLATNEIPWNTGYSSIKKFIGRLTPV